MSNFNRPNRRGVLPNRPTPPMVGRSSPYRSPYDNTPPTQFTDSMARSPHRRRVNFFQRFQHLSEMLTGPALLAVLAVLVILVFVVTLVLVNKPGRAAKAESAAPVENRQDDLTALLEEETTEGKTTILLLGSDRRETDGSFRTDVLLLLSINGDNGTVSAVSFPRDLWVRVPSLYEMKINQVHELGGFKATAEMFEDNFGIRPDYFVMTDFAGFTTFIDEIGGITVKASVELTDDCDLPQQRDGDCTVMPGETFMDGATALWYVRSRNTSNDIDRLRRAQEVIYGVFNQMVSSGRLDQIPALQKQFKEHIKTNLSAARAISLLPVAARVFKNPDKIQRFAITEDQATPSWSWNGMWILLPDEAAIKALLQEAGF